MIKMAAKIPREPDGNGNPPRVAVYLNRHFPGSVRAQSNRAQRTEPLTSYGQGLAAPRKAVSMTRESPKAQEPTVHDHFGRFATAISSWLGSTWAFACAGLVIVIWAATGPIFHFSNRWVQVISIATTLMTFLMVFLIQSRQNRDTRAINLKLNELIRAMDSARNQMIDIERLTDLELDALQVNYERVKTAWAERQDKSTRKPVTK